MDIVDEVIGSYGSVKAVQERFGYKSPMGVYVWRTRGIPSKHLIDIYQDTGIELQRLKTPKN